jgi:hypothetical protein
MAHKLAPFFQVKLGTSFTRTVTTGNPNSGQVYAREYRLLLTVAGAAALEFHVSSLDKTPSGHYAGGTNREQGTVKVGLGGKKTLEDVLNAAVQEADREFCQKYPEAVAA